MEKQKTSFKTAVLSYVKKNPIVILLVAASLVVGCIADNFFSWANFSNLVSNTSVRFVIGLGVFGCLITKGTDLSAGRQIGFAACLASILLQDPGFSGRLLQNWLPSRFPAVPPFVWILLVLLIVCAVGAVFGLINGIIISRFHVPPFIATLGTQTVIYGLTLIMTDAQPIGGLMPVYVSSVTGYFGDAKGFHLPYLFFGALVVGLIFWFVFNKTRFGKNVYAIGGNEVAAEVSGVNVNRSKRVVYLIAGIMYAIAGFLLAAKSGGSSPSMGNGYELEAIAGCTIGGVSTTGGIGRVTGVLVGVLVFELLKIVLQFLGVNPYYNYIVQGVVIVIAVSIDIRNYVKKK